MTEMLLECAKASCCDIHPDTLANFPETELYIKDFPRPLELGLIAETLAAEPAGAAWISIFPEPLHVVTYPMPELTVAVSPKFRKQGIASALLLKLYQRIAESGIQEISLGVHYTNVAAIHLYTQHKWSIAGEINNGEYIMMHRCLTPPT